MKDLAKKSTANQRKKKHNGETVHSVAYKVTTLSILIRLAVVASQICEIQRNSPKIRT